MYISASLFLNSLNHFFFASTEDRSKIYQIPVSIYLFNLFDLLLLVLDVPPQEVNCLMLSKGMCDAVLDATVVLCR